MRFLFALFILIAGHTAFAQNLILKEKQALANLDFSWPEKRIASSYGTPVKIEADQLSFAGDMDAILYADSRGAQVVANAIAKVCETDLGKKALQEKKITKVILKNNKIAPKVSIDKGAMTLLIGFSTPDKFFSENSLRDAIENIL